jgi:hypothetical protein
MQEVENNKIILQVLTGNSKELRAHPDGLEKMLIMRGVFDGIPPLLVETYVRLRFFTHRPTCMRLTTHSLHPAQYASSTP